MQLRDRINAFLRATTGHQVVKNGTLIRAREDLTTTRQKLRRSRGRVKKLEARAKAAEARLRPRPFALPADYPPEMKDIWEAVKDRTMIGHDKVNFLSDAVRYIERYRIPGAVLECGVWRGGAMMTAAITLDLLGSHERDLYLFDTYSGMTEPTERDVHIWNNKPAEDILAKRSKAAPIWQPASLEDVRDGFNAINYPSERLHFVVGKVEDTIPQEAPEQIAILRLDTDWYESTKHEFDHLYDRLVPGGVLIIDDYGSWQGSKEATDEFLDETGEPLLLSRVGRGRVAVKPGLAPRSRRGSAEQ